MFDWVNMAYVFLLWIIVNLWNYCFWERVSDQKIAKNCLVFAVGKWNSYKSPYVKCRNFTWFLVEILWKGTASAEFRPIHQKLFRNRGFSQNVQNRKLGEITVFCTVSFIIFINLDWARAISYPRLCRRLDKTNQFL